MDSVGTRKTLESLMEEWLELSLTHRVPVAMLILSRAFRLMSSSYQPSSDQLLKESIAHLPSQVFQEVAPDTTNIPEDKDHTKKLTSDKSADVDIGSGEVGSVEDLPEKSSKLLDKVEQIEDAVSYSLSPSTGNLEKLEEIKTSLEELLLKTRQSTKGSTAPPSSIELQLSKMVKSLEEDINKAKNISQIPSLDLDNDGLVSCAELSVFLKQKLKFNDDEVKGFLDRLDADADGYVSIESLKNLSDLVVTEEQIRDFMLFSNENKSPTPEEPTPTPTPENPPPELPKQQQ